VKNRSTVADSQKLVSDLVEEYRNTWRLLLEYDEKNPAPPPSPSPGSVAGALDYSSAVDAIAVLKRRLEKEGEAASLFGKPRGEGLRAILGCIDQTMFGEHLYPDHAVKAANLLYLIVKDHPFVDGNKRIGSLLFLVDLKREGMTDRFTPGALTTLTLLIAGSAPRDKDLLIGIIVDLLTDPAW